MKGEEGRKGKNCAQEDVKTIDIFKLRKFSTSRQTLIRINTTSLGPLNKCSKVFTFAVIFIDRNQVVDRV